MGKRRNKEMFIEDANQVHSNKYNYEKSVFVNMTEKITIVCDKHGDFEQAPYTHLQGRGCPKCGTERSNLITTHTSEMFIEKATKVHGNKYDYSEVEYTNSKTKVTIICKEHGEFLQTPNDHLNGYGCQKCANEVIKSKISSTSEEFINKAKEVHGDKYDYSLVDYVGNKKKVKVVCKKHGVFEQQPANHLSGAGCKRCAIETSTEKSKATTEEFIEKSIKIHGDLYDYSKTKYVKALDYLNITCKKHGEFNQLANTHLSGCGCPHCSTRISKSENNLFLFVKEHIDAKQSERKQLEGKELDIYIPSLNIGIEFHGLYYHSDKFKEMSEHKDKYKLCKDKGIRLIQVFEDEWLYKEEIVKSRVLNTIGKTSNKIFARKCNIKEVDHKTASKFLEENHIQGKVNSKIRIGLYYEEELVSLMTFGGLRKNMGGIAKEGHFELLRFCNKRNTTVIGGASKLHKHFEKQFSPIQITSYADLRWSEGDLYYKLNYKFDSESKPNYFYAKGDKRFNRFKYRKSELVKMGFDKNKSESQITKEEGFLRIYDAGTLKFVKNF